MTSDVYDISGAHVIRAYLLDQLKGRLGWTNINNLEPMIPTQQQPEMTNADKPFIIYSYSTTPYGTMWEMCVESMAMSVYSSSEGEIRKAVNFMVDLFKRADWTAADLNTFISLSGRPEFQPFDFKTVTVTASSSDGSEQEGGRMSGFVSIRAQYTHWLRSTPVVTSPVTTMGLGLRSET